MDTWWSEYLLFSQRDQMSFLYAIYINDLTINVINENVNNNIYFYKTKHYSKMKYSEKFALELMYFLKKNKLRRKKIATKFLSTSQL